MTEHDSSEEGHPLQLEVVRALNQVDRENPPYDICMERYERIRSHFKPLLDAVGLGIWCEQVVAHRRFGCAYSNDQPLAECERAYARLREVGFLSASIFWTMLLRFYYLGDFGDTEGQRQMLREIKQFVTELDPRFRSADIDEYIELMEAQVGPL